MWDQHATDVAIERALSPLDTLLFERKVSSQAREMTRSSSPLDTLLFERKVSRPPTSPSSRLDRPATGPSGLLMPLVLRQAVRHRLKQVIEQQQLQRVSDEGGEAPYMARALSPAAAPAITSPQLEAVAEAQRCNLTSSPVDSLLLERKVLRQQRKRAELEEEVGEMATPELWLSGIAFDIDEPSSSRSSSLLPCPPTLLWSAPVGSPRKQARASPGA